MKYSCSHKGSEFWANQAKLRPAKKASLKMGEASYMLYNRLVDDAAGRKIALGVVGFRGLGDGYAR